MDKQQRNTFRQERWEENWKEFLVFGYAGGASLIAAGLWAVPLFFLTQYHIVHIYRAGEIGGFAFMFWVLLFLLPPWPLGYYAFVQTERYVVANIERTNTLVGAVAGPISGMGFATIFALFALIFMMVIAAYYVIGILVVYAMAYAFTIRD